LNPGAMHALISAGSCVNQFTVEAAVFQTAAQLGRSKAKVP
jgi:hypothetical protein